MDCSVPVFSVHRISLARILQRVAISSSRGSSQPRGWIHISCLGKRILYHWATWKAPDTQKTVTNLDMAGTLRGVGYSVSLLLMYTHSHAHMHTYTHTALVPHWVASFIYPFECLTNRSESTYLEITRASSFDCHFLPPLSISSSQKFEVSFDPFFLLSSRSIISNSYQFYLQNVSVYFFSPFILYQLWYG